ncbi:hypothetical protein ABEB36_015271 [Hypothenemus hampei]|uniref:Uncharacterized protein n=1 Tax=Hypothenemus hampei TaxID=57062 RepID=A0ABD1E4B2_HYPHA
MTSDPKLIKRTTFLGSHQSYDQKPARTSTKEKSAQWGTTRQNKRKHNGNNHDTPSTGYNNLRPDQMPQKRSKQENPERSIQKRGKTVTDHSTISPGEEEEPRTPQAPYNSANKCKRHKC